MLVPDFGPTMNVIAYSPFQDGGSAEAGGGSDRAIATDAAHKPTRLLRRSGAISFSAGSATTLELERAATILDVYPIYTVIPIMVAPRCPSGPAFLGSRAGAPRGRRP